MKKGVDFIGVSVGAFILNEKGELFLSKRSQQARNERGKWEAPGGAVDFGERREDAIVREVKEEFGVDADVTGVLQVADEILPEYKQHWVATTFLMKIKDGSPRIMEPDKCDEIGWFSFDNLPSPMSMITQMDIDCYLAKETAREQK